MNVKVRKTAEIIGGIETRKVESSRNIYAWDKPRVVTYGWRMDGQRA
jgi:hypothetical protein